VDRMPVTSRGKIARDALLELVARPPEARPRASHAPRAPLASHTS